MDPALRGIIHYSNSRQRPQDLPTSQPKSGRLVPLDQYTLIPADPTDIPPPIPDQQFILSYLIAPTEDNSSRAFVNVDGMFYESDYAPSMEEPTLFSVLANRPLAREANALYLKKGEVVDITIFNDDPMEHTFHMHG